jgi:Tfp pilus assembly protein FimV
MWSRALQATQVADTTKQLQEAQQQLAGSQGEAAALQQQLKAASDAATKEQARLATAVKDKASRGPGALPGVPAAGTLTSCCEGGRRAIMRVRAW